MNTLKPYPEIESSDLALQLHELVLRNKLLLEQRNLSGPLYRYGSDLMRAKEKVEKGQREHTAGILGHFAVMETDERIVGSASIYPGLSFSRIKFPVPAGITRRVPYLTDPYPGANINLHAWTSGDSDLLRNAYIELLLSVNCFIPPVSEGRFDITWTIEPSRSPLDIHQAITASGLRKVLSGRYDEGESAFRIPPHAVFYAANAGIE